MKMTAVTKREPRGGKGSMAKFSSVILGNATGLLTRAVRWCIARQKARSASRVLHVEETVSLGQKRFAAVIRVENARYLVGGGANDVVLLAALGHDPVEEIEGSNQQSAHPDSSTVNQQEAPEFREVLERVTLPKKPASVKAGGRRTKDGKKQCA